jgi:hypothetical protein
MSFYLITTTVLAPQDAHYSSGQVAQLGWAIASAVSCNYIGRFGAGAEYAPSMLGAQSHVANSSAALGLEQSSLDASHA